jgi:hypothetical protein
MISGRCAAGCAASHIHWTACQPSGDLCASIAHTQPTRHGRDPSDREVSSPAAEEAFPAATETAQPPTQTPLLDMVQQVLGNPLSETTDDFTDPAVPGWLIKSGEVRHGKLIIEGNRAWGGVDLEVPYADGQAVSMLVTIDEEAQTEILFQEGGFNTADDNRFGICLSLAPTTNIW